MQNNSSSVPSANKVYLLIIGALIAFAVMLGLSSVLEQLSGFNRPESIDSGYFILAIVFTLLYWGASSVAWQVAVFRFSQVKLPFLYSFSQISLVLVGKYLPGKLWGLALRGRDLTNMGVSGYQAVISSQAEQVISIHAGLALGTSGWLLHLQPPFWEVALLVILISIIGGAFLNNHLVNGLLRVYAKAKKKVNIEHYQISLGSYLILFMFYILEWLLVGGILCSLWLTVFDPVASLPDIGYLFSVNALAFVAGFVVIFSPGGIGIREGVLVAMLVSIMSLPEAVYLSLLYRVWLVLADAIAGLAAIRILAGTYSQHPGPQI